MTQQELTSIVEAVISALLTSGKTLVQLTTVDEISENDFIELDGGRKVSYATLRDGIVSSNSTTGEVVDYDDRDEITSLSFNGGNGNITIKQRGRAQQTLTIPLATSLQRGLMSDTDLNKLNYSYNKIFEILAALDDKVSNATMLDLYNSYLVKKVKRKYRAVPIEEGFASLMSMGSVLDNIDGGSWTYTHAEGDAWWDPTNNKVYYWQEGAIGSNYFDPSTEVVYYNNHTGRAYRWTGSVMQEVFVVLDSAGRVPETQLPPQVLKSMGSATDNAHNTGMVEWIYQPVQGDYYFENGSGSIKYYGPGGTVDLGEPSEMLIYCNAHTNLLYRWDGYGFVELG